MIDWTNKIENITLNEKPGKCPNCGSENTDYKYTTIKDVWGCCDIWCNDCKHAKHISRVREISNNSDKQIPENLIY